MGKRYNQFRFHSESGFTLVEIMVALVIVLLIVTACYPLFTMATKTTHENRMRMIAGELAKQEIERTLAAVTASNYGSEDPSAPLPTIGINDFIDIAGHPGYKIKKTVEWVDDPDDGLYPVDKFPFDYKQLIIEVSYPSLFGGSVTRKTNFKTFIAREGTALAINGIVVKVVELLDAVPPEDEVMAAAVTITNLDTGDRDFATTNADGLAYFKVDIPAGVNKYNYEVSVEASGLMMEPLPAHVNRVEVEPDITTDITIAMAKPCRINANFVSPVYEGKLQVIGEGYDEIITVAAADSATKITRSFENLWPFNPYQLHAEIPVHKTNFKDEPGFEKSGAGIDIWKYSSDPPEEACWVAEPGEHDPDDSSVSRLKYLMNLSAYSPGDASVKVTGAFISPLSDFTFENDSEENDFKVIEMNKVPDDHDVNNDEHWNLVIDLENINTIITNKDSIPLRNDEESLAVVTSGSFAFRVASTAKIKNFIIKDFGITCRYKAEVTFNSPGENYTVNLTH